MKILVVIGTRPEAIKLIPVCFALRTVGCQVVVCATYQQKELLSQVIDLFGFRIDISLDIMVQAQTLSGLTSKLIEKLTEVFDVVKPDLVMVQGDTTTAFCAGLVSFYKKIKLAHVEAGLRTNDLNGPFPEEFNRKLLSFISEFNYAPTRLSVENLINEGISSNKIFLVGNSVVDALNFMKDGISIGKFKVSDKLTELVKNSKINNKKIILLTLHRREAKLESLKEVCSVIKNFVSRHEDVILVYIRHLNPVVATLAESFEGCESVLVLDPISFSEMVFLLSNSVFVITDSGGVQEEAVTFGKYVVCVRDVTERSEGALAGLIRVTGFDRSKIYQALESFYKKSCETTINNFVNKTVFGDGKTSARIAYSLLRFGEIKLIKSS